MIERLRTKRLLLLIATVAVVGLALGGTALSGVMTASGSNNPSDASLVASAASVVQTRTGVLPTQAEVYHTTRGVAANVVAANAGGKGVDPSEQVTVIVFQGNFVDHSARELPGAAPASGNTISFTYNSSTGESTDYSIGPSPSNISMMGTPTPVSVATS